MLVFGWYSEFYTSVSYMTVLKDLVKPIYFDKRQINVEVNKQFQKAENKKVKLIEC